MAHLQNCGKYNLIYTHAMRQTRMPFTVHNRLWARIKNVMKTVFLAEYDLPLLTALSLFHINRATVCRGRQNVKTVSQIAYNFTQNHRT